ncbi:MAG: glycosyltransferase [Candidatus Uhrbacteria bacterium]
MRTVIVIPTYNERENLEALVERIVTLALPNFEILIVDDNSPDGTGAVADQLATRYPLRVLHRTKKRGSVLRMSPVSLQRWLNRWI